MKINFFRTLWWKLSLYFFSVIILTVLIILINFFTMSHRHMPDIFQREQAEQTQIIAGMLSDFYSEGKDENTIKKDLSRLARITRLQITLLDKEGRVTFKTDAKPPNPAPQRLNKNIRITPDLTGKIKKSESFSEVRFDENEKMRIAYSGYPVYSNGVPVGFLVSAFYMHEPKMLPFPIKGEIKDMRHHAGGPPPEGGVAENRPNAPSPMDKGPVGKPPLDMRHADKLPTDKPPVNGPPGNFFRDLNSILIRSIIISFVIVSIIAFLIARNFVLPIKSMEQAARNIKKGDFSHQMDLDRDDEIGVLSRSFNEMSLKLKKVIQERMQFIGDISHELMTPLTSIQGCAEALIDGVVDDKEKIKKYHRIILDQAKRLSLLKNDLIELSRFEYGEVRIESKPFPASIPVNKAIESAQFIAEKKNVNITSVIQDENLEVMGDHNRILQVVQNLLNNAIQHNQSGTSVRITVEKDRNNEKNVVYAVEDNGSGIPAEELGSIFERFYKVDKARGKGESFAGLGLAIASEIVKAHKSKIEVISSKDGTKFWFALPLC